MSATKWLSAVAALVACASGGCARSSASAPPRGSPQLPLARVADVELPGGSTRFDYQEIDAARGHLVVAHMNDASVLVLNLDGSVAKLLPNIPTPRGVAVGDDRIFVTSSPSQLVLIDAKTLAEIGRVPTGIAPDGVGYDAVDHIVGVSDQRDGAVSLIAGAGSGPRTQVRLGKETGNVVYDAGRGVFWAAVVNAAPPDQLVEIDPRARRVTTRIDLPGCNGAHGIRLHPDGQSAFVACEDNNVLVRVDLGGAHAVGAAPTGAGPDVMAIDPGLGWLYVAAESGDLAVFDIGEPGLVAIDREHPGESAHSVAVDPATHRVFFPLMAGPGGKPLMRILRPKLIVSSAASAAPAPSTSVAGAPSASASAVPDSSAAPSSDPSGAWSFDSDKTGAPPSGFAFGRTGHGKEGRWVVVPAGDAPSAPNVLVQLEADTTDYRFPVAFVDAASFQDVKLSVSCKPVSGHVDQGCGLVWRLKDVGNYYLTRANALEDNVNLYRVVGGRRSEFAGWSGKVASNAWHKLRVDARSDRFEVYFDDKKILDAKDSTFREAGKVGVWTKADSIIEFDDLSATPL